MLKCSNAQWVTSGTPEGGAGSVTSAYDWARIQGGYESCNRLLGLGNPREVGSCKFLPGLGHQSTWGGGLELVARFWRSHRGEGAAVNAH